MGRCKKGHKIKNKDLWLRAGGRDAIVMAFKHAVGQQKDIASPQAWANLVVDVFKTNNNVKLGKWLKVIWAEDRQGIRTEVLLKGKSAHEIII